MLLDQLWEVHLGFSWLAYLPVAAWHVNTWSPKEGRAPLQLLMGVRPRGEIERHIINTIEPPDVPEDAEREAYMDVVRQGGTGDDAAHQVHHGHYHAPQEPFNSSLKGSTTLPLEGFKTKLLKSTGPLKGHSGLIGGNGIGIRRAT